MRINEVGSALANPTRVRLLRLLSENDYTASGAHDAYNDEFGDKKHRESIYRELEQLVDHGFLDKEYNVEEKELQYSLCFEEFKIDLGDSEVNVVK